MSHMQPPLQVGTAGVAAGPGTDAGFAADEPPAPDVPPDDRRFSTTTHAQQASGDSAAPLPALDLQATAAAILASRAVFSDDAPAAAPLERAYSSTGSAGTERTADGTDDAAAAAPASGEGALRIEKLHQQERHMWDAEETQALVDGCNKVSRCCCVALSGAAMLMHVSRTARHRQLEGHPL
jgi:hypothetical protein